MFRETPQNDTSKGVGFENCSYVRGKSCERRHQDTLMLELHYLLERCPVSLYQLANVFEF